MPAAQRPSYLHPKAVLAVSVILPGGGHLVLGQVRRALGFLFFMLVLGWVTTRIAPPSATFVGQHAAGFFVYALSITDAYRRAALARLECHRQPAG